MRFVLLLLIFGLFDFYTFQAFQLVAADWSTLAQWLWFGAFWSIPVLAMILLFSGALRVQTGENKQLFTVLRAIVFIAYFSKLLIAGVLLVDDVRRIGLSAFDSFSGSPEGDITRSMLSAQIALMLGAVPFFTLVYGVIRNPYRYKVFRESIAINGLADKLEGLKIVQISDIHSGSFTLREPVKEAIRLINEQKPDLVFFTGDLVNAAASEMAPFIDIFDKIEAKHGVYSILGNHDYGDYIAWENPAAKQKNFENLLDTHRKMGWDLMLNENRMVQINGEKIAVIGVENYSASPRFPKYGDLRKASIGTEDASLKLLLSHDPSHWDSEVTKAEFNDIAITFSGHTHGAQFGIEIPGWISWSPVKYVYRKWAGLYQEGEQYLYVNRGLGFLGYPGRVGILPEISVIQLTKA